MLMQSAFSGGPKCLKPPVLSALQVELLLKLTQRCGRSQLSEFAVLWGWDATISMKGINLMHSPENVQRFDSNHIWGA